MSKEFTVRASCPCQRCIVKATVKATLRALGVCEPRMLITQTHPTELDVIIAYDETITVK